MIRRRFPALKGLLFAVGCLLVVSGPRAGERQIDPLRLGDAVVPTFESIHLVVDADKTDYRGAVAIDLKVKESTRSFRFHAEDMDLRKIVLTGPGGPIGVEQESGKIGLVTITTDHPLAPGDYKLEIDFENEFGAKAVGLYRMEQDGLGYVFTQFEAEDARKAFPCWDEPGFKIPYQVTLTVPEGHLAVTNTPIARETLDAGRRTIVFARTKPLPSYLLAIAEGPLETIPIEGMSIKGRVVTVKGKSGLAGTAARTTPAILAALEKYFDSKYPFAKLDLIAIPEYWPGAMENPGAVTFADRILLVDPAAVSIAQRRGMARVIAHELSHMWFGDVVTMQWWDDLWLNESFADWMGDKITAQVHPEFRLDLSEMGSIQGIMDADARPSTPAIRRPFKADQNKFQGIGVAYSKGKAVLSMFERWLGPEKFRQGVLAHIQANAWGNATASDLWRSLSKVSGGDVASAMPTFLTQNGVPLIDVIPLDGGRVKLTQRRFLNSGVSAEPRQWHIPVTLRYPAGDMTQTTTVLLKQPSRVVKLAIDGTPPWILPDADALGYYRWSMPEKMLLDLAGPGRKRLNERERIGFIGNLSALLGAGVIHGDAYLESLGHFSGDPQPQVLTALLDALGDVKQAFVPAELEDDFAAYIRETLHPALARFGLEKRPGEPPAVSLFRPRLIGWLGDDGHDEAVLEHAEKLARSYMADPTSIDPSLAGVALRLAAIRGDKALFEEYLKRFESAKTPAERSRYLSASGSFRKPELMEAALELSLDGKVRPNEMFRLSRGVARSPEGRDLSYKYMVDHYDAILSRLPADRASFMPFFASGCSARRLADARKFFSEANHDKPGTKRSLERVADQVTDCVRLREREGDSVKRYLGRLTAGM
ncbi:MAG: M1 family metallopeptidase [Acidobacteriota bacterium]